ncbi:MAG: methyl-accepting chemotaxis protein [Desulfatibacillaceae bacterium]
MKLRTKLLGGFVAILALVVIAVGVYQYVVSDTTGNYQTLLETEVAIANLAEELDVKMLQMRRVEKNFLLRTDEQYLAEHDRYLGEFEKDADELLRIARAAGKDDAVQSVERVTAIMKQYKSDFDQVGEALTRRGLDYQSGLNGEMVEMAETLQAEMAEHAVDDLYIAFQVVRKYEKDLLRTRSAEYREKFAAALDDYGRLLAASQCDPVAKESQVKGLEVYRGHAGRLMRAGDGELVGFYDDMRDVAHVIEGAIESVYVPNAASMVLDVRWGEKSYLIRRMDQYITYTRNALDRLKKAFDSAPILQEHKEKVGGEIESYRQSFEGLVAIDKDVAQRTDAMQAAVSQVDPEIRQLLEAVTAEARTISANTAARAGSLSILAIVLGAVAIVVVVGLIFMVNNSTNNIVSIAGRIREIAENRDFTIDVPVTTQDEIGEMASELNGLVGLLRETFVIVDGAAEDVEGRATDVAGRATANRQRAEHEEKQITEIRQTVAEMGATAGEVSSAAHAQAEAAHTSRDRMNGLARGLGEMAEASGRQTVEVDKAVERVRAMGETGGKVVATAQAQGEQVTKVTEAVNMIERAVREMTQSSERATEHGEAVLAAAREGAESVRSTVEGMAAISQASDQISEIIDVITEIAEQTNLLALNAAIEAARAGAHGKGFAVVADEVGKLAQRSSEAAKEITGLIKNSTVKVEQGTRLTDQSRVALDRITEGGKVNLDAIVEISTSSRELADATERVHTMMEDLNRLAGEIAGMAGMQGERREAAESALASVTEAAARIARQVDDANKVAGEVSEQMESIVKRTELMDELTDIQAGRSKRLREITEESLEAAKATLVGAGQVVDITQQLQNVSSSLTRQITQFKVAQANGSTSRENAA